MGADGEPAPYYSRAPYLGRARPDRTARTYVGPNTADGWPVFAVAEALNKLPSEVNERETLDGIFDMIEWLQVQRDNRDAEREAEKAAREAGTSVSAALPGAFSKLAAAARRRRFRV